MHPRCRAAVAAAGISLPSCVTPLSPVGYFEMMLLLQRCRFVLTDSGGLQKEAYWFRRRCVTLRDETEWVETLEDGWNVLVGADVERIGRAVCAADPSAGHRPLYGDGRAAERVAAVVSEHFLR
jgi:UDP-N-acetylglucosamine 2-epimerase